MFKKQLALTVATIGIAGFGLTACDTNGHVKKADVEKQVATQLQAQIGEAPKSVVCDGNLPAKVNASERCLLTATDGSSIGLTVTTTSVDGKNVKFSIKVDAAANGPSASATPDSSSTDSAAPDDNGTDSSSTPADGSDTGSDTDSSTAPDDGTTPTP